MKRRLSFGYANVLSENIVEIMVDEGIEITLEMIEECDEFFATQLPGDIGVLINRINDYRYTYEAKLTVASYAGIKAMAVVNYNSWGEQITRDLLGKRAMDDWNLKSFSGLELGWQQAYDWLQNELILEQAS